MDELEVIKPQVQEALLENGDLIRALEALVTPPNFAQDDTECLGTLPFKFCGKLLWELGCCDGT
jgi:hypothetical protein